MRAYQLDSQGNIVNVVVVANLDSLPNLVAASDGGEIGDKIQNGHVIKRVPSAEEANAPILKELLALDMASIRPLREGETAKLAELTEKAVALRSKLKK